MPAIRYYSVTQTREVLVVANNSIDALRVASAHLDKEPIPVIEGAFVETNSEKELEIKAVQR